jgi:N-acetylglutamate synthase-like GNAT family acetyltransferase
MSGGGTRLLATPLAAWERDGLKAALTKAGLPADDAADPHLLFWRFETVADIPAGFGGIEVHGRFALLHSLVTLPPVRGIGIGRAMVAALEVEARTLKCCAIYLVTTSHAAFFQQAGYTPCASDEVPEEISRSRHFRALCCASGRVMVKKA